MRFFSLSLFFLIFSINLMAKDAPAYCTTVDLRENLGPARDQGKMYWCYAHAAADMLAHHYSTAKLSATDIALGYNNTALGSVAAFIFQDLASMFRRDDEAEIEAQTGFLATTLVNSMERGFCPWKNLPDETITRSSNSQVQEVDYLVAMKDILLTYRDSLLTKRTNYPYKYLFPQLDSGELENILVTHGRKEVFDEIADRSCNNSRIFPKKMARVLKETNKANLLPFIHNILSQGQLAGIEYFEDVLFTWPKFSKKFEDLHTSTIVARKWNPEIEKCQVLVRESYGSSCRGYCTEKGCEPFSSHFTCEEGHLWVEEDVLNKALLQVIQLK